MIESVPALARLSTAHCSTWLGASPGCQFSPCGLVFGATCFSSASYSRFCFSAFRLVIDRLGALVARHREPVLTRIDRENAAGIHQLRAGDRALADRAAAEH